MVATLSKASISLRYPQQLQAAKVCEVCKALFKAKAKSLVVGAAGAPMLVAYSNDGTRLVTRKRVSGSVDGQHRVTREDHKGEELLVQQAFL
eukprot:8297319-Lingulodinium_polyedra.AAC.1